MVPRDCMKIDDTVNNDEDLRSLLVTLRFWVASCIYDSVVAYTMSNFTDSTEEALSHFYHFFHQILQCFLETGLPWSVTPEAMLRLIDSGFLEGLQCLVENGCHWHTATTSRMAHRGNSLEMLQYVREKGCPWSFDTCVRAASLECLEYAHTHGAPLHPNTCSLQLSPHLGAPATVTLECFQYAHLHGGRPESHFIATAARMGHLPLLKYLHEQGCVMESQSALTATQHGHAECL